MQYEPWQRGWRVTGRWEGGRYEETVSCEDGRDCVCLYIYVCVSVCVGICVPVCGCICVCVSNWKHHDIPLAVDGGRFFKPILSKLFN